MCCATGQLLSPPPESTALPMQDPSVQARFDGPHVFNPPGPLSPCALPLPAPATAAEGAAGWKDKQALCCRGSLRLGPAPMPVSLLLLTTPSAHGGAAACVPL
eukprot:1159459-Pelagomonas_calceolata.AAC.14